MKKKRMKDLPQSTRPQEKLWTKGPENLSDAELVAILLGTGNRVVNALQLADAVLRKNALTTVSFAQLTATKGIGKVKAARVVASLELGKRLFAAQNLSVARITQIADILQQVQHIAEKKQEHVVVLYLNARQEVVQKEIVAIGKINALSIEPKEIFLHALQNPCTSIIVVHNHPSGDPTPSDDDIRFTQRMQQAGEVLGLVLMDHVIVTKHGYFSFAEGASSSKNS